MFFTDLETERLLLKGIGPEDAAFMYRQFSNDEVNRFLFDAEPIACVEQAEEWIRFYTREEPRDCCRWILIRKDTGERIGTCGFHCWDRQRRACEMGYDLDPAHWGNGYMQEALSAIVGFARDRMRVARIEAHIAEGNAASFKAARRQGFTDSQQTFMERFRGREYLHRIYTREFADSETGMDRIRE